MREQSALHSKTGLWDIQFGSGISRVGRFLEPRDRGPSRWRTPSPPWKRNRDLPAMFGLAAIALLYAWMRVVKDPDYFRGDIITQFLPYYSVVGERLRSGDIPGWNPALFSGMPLAGDPISGWGYLPVMSLFPFFAPVTAYKLFIAFHLAGAALAGFALGRVLGMGTLGAFATGSAYLLGPQYGFSQCCTARMQLIPWFAIALAGVVLVSRADSTKGRVLWWGVSGLAISQMIAGYFGKGFYYGIIAVCAFLTYQVLLDNRYLVWQRVVWLGIHTTAIVGFGVGLSAMTLLPRLDFLSRSNLEGGSYESASGGAAQSPAWPIERTLETILNARSTTYYLGAMAVVLACAALALAGRRYSVPFFALYATIILILTTEPTPLHHVFYLIPKFQTIHEHHPHRILTMLNIAPAVLAGSAIAAIEQGFATTRRLLIACAAIATGFLLVYVLTRGGDALNPAFGEATLIGIVALLVVTAVGVLVRNSDATSEPPSPPTPSPRRKGEHLATWLSAALVVLLVFELDAGRGLGALKDGWSNPPTGAIGAAYSDSEDDGGAGGFLREQQVTDGPFRFFGYDAAYLQMSPRGGGRNYRLQWRNPDAEALLVNNRAMMLDLFDIQGYTPAHPMDYVRWMDAVNGQSQEYHETDVLPTGLSSPLLNLLNARFIIVPAEVSPGRPDLLHLSQRYPTVYADSSVRVLERMSALPRAWMVHAAEQASFDEAVALLDMGLIDPRETVLLESDVQSPSIEGGAEGHPGRVAVLLHEPDLIRYQVESEEPGYLVASETYDPGWRAYVDGEPVPLLRANGILRAVAVPAGVHQVELRFEPSSLRNGLAVSAITVFLWIMMMAGAVWFDRYRRRRLAAG